jgi:CTP synthase
MPKWIFVTGGVLSGLGKGLVSASVSKLLQLRNQQIVPIKCDGYLNVDPGTMNPHEHGEVYVLEDGTEVDMDFGHYERFLGVKGKGEWNLTSGKIFQEVIDKEREGEYLGKTVQMVPHVTNQIRQNWEKTVKKEDADIAIIEIGGTVGDIENMLYLETVRQMRSELPKEDTFLIHTTLVPFLETTGEQKTKPTQHSVKELQETGLSPDMIVGRSPEPLEEDVQEKIALFCDVEKEAVISDPNLDHIYQLPIKFQQQSADEIISRKIKLPTKKQSLQDWKNRVKNLENGEIAEIGICGKYTEMDDSYASVEEALKHAAAEQGGTIKIKYIDTENLQPSQIENLDGIIIPGGFGNRGIKGKIKAIKHCRKKQKPLLGLCLGLQLMVIEYAENKLGLNATSEEFAEPNENDEDYIIKKMPNQENIEQKGGTMRLGSYTAELKGKTKQIYQSKTASERHRHRYEINPEYHKQLEENGLKISGRNAQNPEIAEYIEHEDHPFFIGTQAHPEFNSTFTGSNPLFHAFVKQASK